MCAARRATLALVALAALTLVEAAPRAALAVGDDVVDPLAYSPLGAQEETRRRIVKRPDEDRPPDQLRVPILGRPLTIGGQWELASRFDADTRLGSRPDDDELSIDQRLEVELFYAATDDLFLYLEGKFFYRTVPWTEAGLRDDRFSVERGESWIYLSDVFGSPFSLQVGRQRMNESSEWWWDEDLDAVRLHFDRGDVHLETAVAEELVRLGDERDDVDPRRRDVFRVLSQATWQWFDRQYVEGFVHHQRDHSPTERPFTIVSRDLEDPVDASLTWYGVGANGRVKTPVGRVYYRSVVAFVRGHENVVDYDTDPFFGLRFVDTVNRHAVNGWATDVALTLSTDLPGELAFTAGYAFGSGESSSRREADRSFRQSELPDNNGRFRGVDRFRYYGELVEPNLSNLHIATVSLGARFLRQSSVELVYHAYEQVEPAPFLFGSSLRRAPTGRDRSIGHEWDVVLGVEEWDQVQVELIGGVFRAGDAFGPAAGDLAYLGYLEVQFNF